MDGTSDMELGLCIGYGSKCKDEQALHRETYESISNSQEASCVRVARKRAVPDGASWKQKY